MQGTAETWGCPVVSYDQKAGLISSHFVILMWIRLFGLHEKGDLQLRNISLILRVWWCYSRGAINHVATCVAMGNFPHRILGKSLSRREGVLGLLFCCIAKLNTSGWYLWIDSTNALSTRYIFSKNNSQIRKLEKPKKTNNGLWSTLFVAGLVTHFC